MSTLYIRLPSRAAASHTAVNSSPNWQALACPYALASDKRIERQGVSPLPTLSDSIAKAQRVVLLLAASDVTLLHVQVPPLPASKLKAALPNLVEDQLLSDPSDCVVVAGNPSSGLRTVAVVQRAWLDTVVRAVLGFGARHLCALPAQLCLPPAQAGGVTAALHDWNNAGIDITLVLQEAEGIGLAVGVEQNESAAQAAIRALSSMLPSASITLFVPQALLPDCQQVAGSGPNRISVSADTWQQWIAGANDATLDLSTGLELRNIAKLDWRAWKWPLALVVAVLLTNTIALNVDWLRMKREAATLRTTMIQTYQSAYPKETVIIDPLAQMQQKIALAKRASGQAAQDDFIAIAAAFGEAWSDATAGKAAPALAIFEYREHSLTVRLKGNGDPLLQPMKTALAQKQLGLEVLSDPGSATIWKIRSTQ